MGIPVKLENVVVCYPQLKEPHSPPGVDNPKFGCEIILDPSNPSDGAHLQSLEKAFIEVLTGAGKGQFAAQMPRPFRAGNLVNQERGAKGKTPRPEIADKWLLRAGRSVEMGPPPVVDQATRPYDGGAIFGGCICNLWVDLYWSPNPTNPGCYCGLNGLQLVKDVGVERVGVQGPSVEEMFQPLPGAPAPLQPAPADSANLAPPWA